MLVGRDLGAEQIIQCKKDNRRDRNRKEGDTYLEPKYWASKDKSQKSGESGQH